MRKWGWERSRYPLCKPPYRAAVFMCPVRAGCILAPDWRANGALPQQWPYRLGSLLKRLKIFGLWLEQLSPRAFCCHPGIAPSCFNLAPVLVAAPWLEGVNNAGLGQAHYSESCWQWILVFHLGFLFCFLSPRGAISSCYSNWHCLCIKRNRVLRIFGGRMWRRGPYLGKLAASRKNKKLKGHHGFGLSGGTEAFLLSFLKIR